MNSIQYNIIEDLQEAKNIWHELSPQQFLDDEWEYRYAYYKYFDYPLYFKVAYSDNVPVGLLPLQWNPEKNYLEFFGGTHTKNNAVFTKKGYENTRQLLIDSIPKPFRLTWMRDEMKDIKDIQLQDYNYSILLEGLSSSDDYIEKAWSGKSKRNLKSQIKKINKEYGILVQEDQDDDLDNLILINKQNFGEKSVFNKPYRVDIIKDLYRTFNATTFSLIINGEKKSVNLSIAYKDFSVSLYTSTKRDINNLGKYAQLISIQRSIQEGAKILDKDRKNLNWKESFCDIKTPLYFLEKLN